LGCAPPAHSSPGLALGEPVRPFDDPGIALRFVGERRIDEAEYPIRDAVATSSRALMKRNLT
jgi:hypothetical protein